ncbi:MAG: sterol desaturase family protein [Gammaproteobacteria bacterium]|nr:sterol desaturase family protein [Gammaproteobacteria bacterium]MDH5802258.1 sterol desaturase family protein [Gammaproteobacteria bacterium]
MVRNLETWGLRLAYPAVMASALGLHFLLLWASIPLAVAAYVPVIFSIVAINLLERYYPFHKPWCPDKSDIATDLTFLVFLQMILPQLALMLVLFALAQSGVLSSETLSHWWPHDWPVLAQFVLMALLIDFSTYWVHRGLHGIPVLWRFHAVHHSVKKLYWLNVHHDHALEALFLFGFGLMPFMVMGVNESVLAFFVVIFGSHAFFQHSNINISYGFLNYLLSTSELHRWHHARDTQLSEHNFGNTLSIWDMLFGTWYFPHAQFHDIGLKNDNYPQGFFNQMRTPFIKGLADRELPFSTYAELAQRLLHRVKRLRRAQQAEG